MQEEENKKEPALHVQSVEEELPTGASEYVGQVKHVDSSEAPTAAEYLLTTQSMQEVAGPPPEYFPAPHRVQLDDEANEYVPSVRHSKHVVDNEVSENLPASQSLQAVADDIEYLPRTHQRHVEGDVADEEYEYVPSWQGVQPVDDGMLYLPAKHPRHV
jgi:hypothetical protein